MLWRLENFGLRYGLRAGSGPDGAVSGPGGALTVTIVRSASPTARRAEAAVSPALTTRGVALAKKVKQLAVCHYAGQSGLCPRRSDFREPSLAGRINRLVFARPRMQSRARNVLIWSLVETS